MKRILGFGIALAFTFLMFTPVKASTIPDGDVNLDGKTTSADARLVLRYVVGLDDLSQEQINHCDFERTRKINAASARSVLRLSLKLSINGNIDFTKSYSNYELETFLDQLPITSTEKYQLCNVLGREYGANWISIPEKAKVIAVIMNRVHSDSYDFRNVNTIDAVLSQSGQFGGKHGGVSMYSYSSTVTSSVKMAVLYYFHVAQYDHDYSTYLYYWGDGWKNYFRSSY